MEFNKSYNRDEFLSFLRVNFLPEDFKQETNDIDNPRKACSCRKTNTQEVRTTPTNRKFEKVN